MNVFPQNVTAEFLGSNFMLKFYVLLMVLMKTGIDIIFKISEIEVLLNDSLCCEEVRSFLIAVRIFRNENVINFLSPVQTCTQFISHTG